MEKEEIQSKLRDWSVLEPVKGEITLYWANGSIPSMKVIMVLDEKQVPYHLKRLKIMTNPKQTKLPEFLELNPRGKTPTLVDDSGETRVVLYESLAIMSYINQKYPNPPLIPSDIAKFGLMEMRKAESNTFLDHIDPLEYLFYKKAKRKRFVSLIDNAQRKVLYELEFLWNEYLKDKNYLAGDDFTLADCAFWPILGYLVHHGLPIDTPKLSNVRDYYLRINERPSATVCWPIGWEHKGRNLFIDVSNELEDA